jgi:hypothetical protein
MPKEQILALVRRYLERGIDRSVFSEQFASLYFQVRNSRNAPLDERSLCSSLMLPFAELSRGHRTEASFRKELENAIRPFAKSDDQSFLLYIVWNSDVKHSTLGKSSVKLIRKPASPEMSSALPIWSRPEVLVSGVS